MPTKTKLKQEKVRLNLDLTPQAKTLLEDLQERSDAPSLTEVIRRALALYDLVLEQGEKGGNVILEDDDGTRERLRIL